MSAARVHIAGAGGGVLLRTLGVSWRVRFDGEGYVHQARRVSPHVIFACWHGKLLPLCWTHRGRNIFVLASEHRDGQTLARAISPLGFGQVRGSSEGGGARAVRNLIRVMKNGADLGIVVDGPRGPRGVVKPGVITIASLTGAAIVPVTAGSTRKTTVDSWDQFEVPAPFARVWVRHGEPIAISRGAGTRERMRARERLERSLESLTREVDVRAAR